MKGFVQGQMYSKVKTTLYEVPLRGAIYATLIELQSPSDG